MFYVSLFVFVFFLALTTMADVKKEFGEFRTVHTEQVKNEPVLHRQYSSRSLFKGAFGFNWCSQLDYKIAISDNEMSLYDCEAGKRIVFKKINGDRFHSTDLQNDLVIENSLIRYERSPLTLYFLKDGRLSHWTAAPSKDAIRLIYKSDVISQLQSPTIGLLTIEYGKDGLVKSLGKQFGYEYNQGLLTAVLKDGKPVYRYQYDEFLNMTLWRGPSSSEEMKYDSEWDRIVYLKDKNECRFHFQYEMKDSKKFILESKKCLNSKEKETLFEMVSPRLLVKSPSDQLGKEFRQGATNETTF